MTPGTEFVGTTPPLDLGAAMLVGATVLDPEPRNGADLVVGIRDGEIVAVGDRSDVEEALPVEHRVVDLTGLTLTPGFADTHLHPLALSFFEHHVDLDDATSIDEVADRLRERAATTDPDQPVLGLRIDDARLAERRLPTRDELDRIGDGRRVVLLRRDGHHAIGSTSALHAAGFHGPADAPDNGYLGVADDGELSGLCGEAASSQLLGSVPSMSWAEYSAATSAWSQRLVADGITAISAMCQTDAEGPAGAAGSLEAAGWSGLVDLVPFDVQTILIGDGAACLDPFRGGNLDTGDGRRRLDGLKIFLDGTLGGHSACLHEPYADDEGSGMLTLDRDVAYRRIESGHLAGLSVCVHAIGDRATRLAAEMFDRVHREHPGPSRHRVEHASVVDDETLALLAEHGVAAVVQPISLRSEHHWLEQRLGDERLARTYAYRSMLDAGITVAYSSDAPIEATGVSEALHATVDRLGIAAEQSITPLEALVTATSAAARVRGVDSTQGRIAVGHRADLAVLTSDPRDGWDRVDVASTIIGGVAHHGADRLVPKEQP